MFLFWFVIRVGNRVIFSSLEDLVWGIRYFRKSYCVVGVVIIVGDLLLVLILGSVKGCFWIFISSMWFLFFRFIGLFSVFVFFLV